MSNGYKIKKRKGVLKNCYTNLTNKGKMEKNHGKHAQNTYLCLKQIYKRCVLKTVHIHPSGKILSSGNKYSVIRVFFRSSGFIIMDHRIYTAVCVIDCQQIAICYSNFPFRNSFFPKGVWNLSSARFYSQKFCQILFNYFKFLLIM